MTPAQLTALSNPCARAWATLAPEFSRTVIHKSERIRALLTVNK
jgi:hypothetical protein